MLLIKSVTPEDVAEIKFTAEKASSTAKLTVKGKVYFQHALPIAWYLRHDMLSNIGYNNIFRSAHHNILYITNSKNSLALIKYANGECSSLSITQIWKILCQLIQIQPVLCVFRHIFLRFILVQQPNVCGDDTALASFRLEYWCFVSLARGLHP